MNFKAKTCDLLFKAFGCAPLRVPGAERSLQIQGIREMEMREGEIHYLYEQLLQMSINARLLLDDDSASHLRMDGTKVGVCPWCAGSDGEFLVRVEPT